MTAPTRIRPATEPVFLDRTGRRRRIVVVVGAAATVVLTLLLLALLAGFTSVGGAVPGWPAADRYTRPAPPIPHRTGPSSSAAVRATAVTRPAGPATLAPTGRTSSPAVTAATTVASASATPTASATSATTPGNGHRHNPSHTPNPHSSKKP